MLDPRWREAHRKATLRNGEGLMQLAPPPRNLSGDQISVHRFCAADIPSAGTWFVWCERGPIEIYRRGRQVGREFPCEWVMNPDHVIGGYAPDSLRGEFEEWMAAAGIDAAPTRRQLLDTLRAALRGGAEPAFASEQAEEISELLLAA